MPINKLIQKIFEMPLYERFECTEVIKKTLMSYLDNESYNQLTVNLYCTECNDNSIFNPSNEKQLENDGVKSFSFFKGNMHFAVLHYRCARDRTHYICAQLMYDGKNIFKIGQFPSKADIEFPEFNRFAKILPKDQLADLKRSAGLASHGIGAGSFVYLRRVIEFLIAEAHDEALRNERITEEAYQKKRFVEKIKMLRDFLPPFMSENASAYGILSKGVHELSENECLESYELLKITVELILDDILTKRERDEKQEKIKKGINTLNSKLLNSEKEDA